MRPQRWTVVAVLLAAPLLLFGLSLVRLSIASDVAAATRGPGEPAWAANDGVNGLGSTGDPDNSPSATLLDSTEARAVLGSAVRSAANEDMGRIVDVIVDGSGMTRAAVIDFGGFLGVGNRKIAVDWNSIKFGPGNRITVELTRDQVKAAPEYQPGKPVVVLGAAPSYAQSHLTERIPER